MREQVKGENMHMCPYRASESWESDIQLLHYSEQGKQRAKRSGWAKLISQNWICLMAYTSELLLNIWPQITVIQRDVFMLARREGEMRDERCPSTTSNQLTGHQCLSFALHLLHPPSCPCANGWPMSILWSGTMKADEEREWEKRAPFELHFHIHILIMPSNILHHRFQENHFLINYLVSTCILFAHDACSFQWHPIVSGIGQMSKTLKNISCIHESLIEGKRGKKRRYQGRMEVKLKGRNEVRLLI